MSFHANPFMLLGGDLSGTLPNPRVTSLSGETILQGQVFAPRGRANTDLSQPAQQIEAAQIFARSMTYFPRDVADSQQLEAVQVFARAIPQPSRNVADSQQIEAGQVFTRAILPLPRDVADTQQQLANREFSSRPGYTPPAIWNFNKISTDSGQLLSVPAGYEIVFSMNFTNSGTINNSGRFTVI